MKSFLTKKNTVYFVGLMTLWRFFLAATLQLHQDEAYYWLWAKRLDLSYFDHPPMVGYFIWVTTVLSNAEVFVRLSAVLVPLFLSVLIWKLAEQIHADESIAAGSVMLINILPLTIAGSLIMTPDVPVFLFWGLSVYWSWQIVRTGKTRYWYLLGIGFGLALLSKYTAVLLAPCLFLFFVCTDERKWLKTIHPYLALLVSVLIFVPVIYWNKQHDWISFKFQLGHGLSTKSAYSIANLLEFIGGQLLVVTPLVWLVGMVASLTYIVRKEKKTLFLAFLSLPIIVFFAYASLKKAGEANWPALGYFTFVIIVAGYLLKNGTYQKLRKGLFYVLWMTSFILSMIATLHTRFTILDLSRFNKEWALIDATNFFYGWKELGAKIQQYPSIKVILTPSHQLSALISYYTDAAYVVHVDEKLTRISQYNLWQVPAALAGQDGLYVNTDEMTLEPYTGYFSSCAPPDYLTVYRKQVPIRTYRIVLGKQFIKA